MKLTCQQADLLAALALLAKAIPKRQFNEFRLAPYLRLEARAGTLELSGTNGELGLRCEIAAQVQEASVTLLPHEVLSDLIGAWKPGQISIESIGGSAFDLRVQSGASRSQSMLRGMDPQDFPAFPPAEGRLLMLDAGQLKHMIAQVAFAASSDQARPIFTFVLMELGTDTFQLVAADDARLSLSACPLAGTSSESVLVPAKALSRLATLLPEAGVVELRVGERLQVSCDTWTLWTPLGEGKYPTYQMIIAQQAQARVVLPTSDFAQAVKSIVPFARQDSHKAFLKVDPVANAVVLSAEAADLGSNACVVDATTCEGASMEMTFNYKGLQDLLPALDAERVILELNGPRRPGKITTDPTSGGSTTFTYILSPVVPTA